jgi:hypothetical protein
VYTNTISTQDNIIILVARTREKKNTRKYYFLKNSHKYLARGRVAGYDSRSTALPA